MLYHEITLFLTSIVGSGYTVEGQATSVEQYGGLQLEFIPQWEPNLRVWTQDNDRHISLERNGLVWFQKDLSCNEMKTPQELGCSVGDILRSYHNQTTYYETFIIKDLRHTNGKAILKVSLSWNCSSNSTC